MLVLTLKFEDGISLFDKRSGERIGRITRIPPQGPHPKLLFGFDFPKYINIVRDKAIRQDNLDSDRTS